MTEKWRNLTTFGYASLLVLWSCCALSELVKLQLANELFFFVRDGITYISDFLNFYRAGLIVWSADRFFVYDPVVQLKWINQVIHPAHTDKVFYFQYPPFAFALLAPLGWLPMAWAYWALCLSGVVAAAVAVTRLLKSRGVFQSGMRTIFLIGLLCSFPSWYCLRLGQLSFFLIAAFVLFYLALARGRHALAGLALALTSIKPQYAVFLSVAPLALGRFPVIAWAFLFEVVLAAAAVATVGWSNVVSYPAILLSAESSPDFMGVAPFEMVNIRGLTALALPLWDAAAVSALSLAAGLALVFFVWWRARGDDASRLAWAMSLTVIAALAFSPHAHKQDLLFLALPAALTLPAVSAFDLPAGMPAARLWWCRLAIAYPALSWIMFLSTPLWLPCRVQMFSLINLLWLALGLACIRPVEPAKTP